MESEVSAPPAMATEVKTEVKTELLAKTEIKTEALVIAALVNPVFADGGARYAINHHRGMCALLLRARVGVVRRSFPQLGQDEQTHNEHAYRPHQPHNCVLQPVG